jgi:mycoredoxin
VPPLRSLVIVLASFVGVVVGVVGSSGSADAKEPSVSSLASSPVTVYGAKWCSACRALEHGLTDRKIAFEVIDVDENPAAFARARAAAGATNAIPLTGIVRSSNTVWVIGADVDAVDRAQRGE